MKFRHIFTLLPFIGLVFQGRIPEVIVPQELAAYDNFGSALAVSGEYLAVGAPGVDLEGVRNAGAVFVFQGSGHNWKEIARLTPEPDQEMSGFGTTLALDGATLAVGARYEYNPGHGNGSGAVYIYRRNGAEWRLQTRLLAQDSQPFDLFGYALALKGDTLAVGARAADAQNGRSDCGAVYIYQRSGEIWELQDRLQPTSATAFDHFGETLALGEGELFASAPDHDAPQAANSGLIYRYRLQGQSWVESDHLQAQNPHPAAHLGSSLSLDGDLLVALADLELAHEDAYQDPMHNSVVILGAAYVFQRQGDQWRWQARLTGELGNPYSGHGGLVSLILDTQADGGARLAIAGLGDNTSYFRYQLKGQEWQFLETVTATGIDLFNQGQAIAMSGKTVLLGLRMFPLAGVPDAQKYQVDGAGAILPLDWPE